MIYMGFYQSRFTPIFPRSKGIDANLHHGSNSLCIWGFQQNIFGKSSTKVSKTNKIAYTYRNDK